jgi:hypothetical protein
MATTKADIFERPLSDQEGLVSMMLKSEVKKVKRLIPGGANMLSTLDQESLERACFNWLRAKTFFDEFTLSLAKDPAKIRTKETKIQSFPETKHLYWDSNAEGKRKLAKDLAAIMKKRKFVYLTVKKDGIYLAEDAENKFSPFKKATLADIEDYKSRGKEVIPSVGDNIKSDEWEPYIEFLPQRKSKYA